MDTARASVKRTCERYSPLINADPGLLSLLYDINLLPEQLLHVAERDPRLAMVNGMRMIAVCELWKRLPQQEEGDVT